MLELCTGNFLNTISSIIIIIAGIYFKGLEAKMRKRITHDEATQLGIQALLRAEIIRENLRLTTQGYASLFDRESLQNIFIQYNNLGANGIMDELVDQVKALPIYCKKEEGNIDN